MIEKCRELVETADKAVEVLSDELVRFAFPGSLHLRWEQSRAAPNRGAE
jgi:hypothetical protein